MSRVKVIIIDEEPSLKERGVTEEVSRSIEGEVGNIDSVLVDPTDAALDVEIVNLDFVLKKALAPDVAYQSYNYPLILVIGVV